MAPRGDVIGKRMNDRFAAERVGQKTGDYTLLALLTLLLGLGLSTLFSASYYTGTRLFNNAEYFFYHQLVYGAVGLVLSFILSRISLDLVRRAIPALVFITLFLVLMTFIPGLSIEVLGARRWIRLFGYTFQPSELVKLTIILYLAHVLAKKEDKVSDLTTGVLPPLLVALCFVTLVYLQNDFSTAVFILFLSLAMFYVGRIRIAHFSLLALILVPLSGLLLFAKEHRVVRFLAFWDPNSDPLGRGYQIAASQTALTHGGLWGRGFGRGTRKFGGLPEVHSDFVFAVVGEEAGFIGVVFVLALFLAFAVKGYMIGFISKDRFGYYLAFGITTYILFQGLFNMAVVAGLVPATGIPLPFFSSGGSSILVTLAGCGLIMNLSRQSLTRREYPGHE